MDLLNQILAVVFVISHTGKYVFGGVVDLAHQTDLDAFLNIVSLIDREHIHPDHEWLFRGILAV
jgi:hypothetical protein